MLLKTVSQANHLYTCILKLSRLKWNIECKWMQVVINRFPSICLIIVASVTQWTYLQGMLQESQSNCRNSWNCKETGIWINLYCLDKLVWIAIWSVHHVQPELTELQIFISRKLERSVICTHRLTISTKLVPYRVKGKGPTEIASHNLRFLHE